MKVERTDYGALAVLAPKGDLTGEDVEAFSRESQHCAETSGGDMIIDGSGITAFDSAGLEALTDLGRRCGERGGALKICGLDAVGRKIFEVTRLNHKFELFDDVEAAIRSYS